MQTELEQTGVGAGLILKFLPAASRPFSLGARIAVQTLKLSDQYDITYPNGDNGKAAAYYAYPMLQLALQGHLNLPVTYGVGFRLSPYAGVGYAFSEHVGRTGSGVVKAYPVGNSMGFNAGFDLGLYAAITPRLTLMVSSGFQRSWMRFYSANYIAYYVNGFNISQVPVNLGLGIRL